jgi:MFS family permease
MGSLIRKYFSGLTRDTILLAFSSLFSDISTEMLYPIIPIYLTDYLKTGGGVVGIIEGIAQAAQNIIQGLSGYVSDKWQRRKPVALFGYMLSAVSKPFIGLFTAWPGVMTARITDRLGSGCKSAPRDALVAASVKEKDKGKAFGLEGIGDNMGAFLGPLLTVLLFFSLHFGIRSLFYLAIIPGLLAFTMVLFVRERNGREKAKAKLDMHIGRFPKEYWKYLAVTALFGLGNSSNSFLILIVKDKGLSLIDTIIIYALYNLVAALISYPAGALSDKYGRKPVLLAGFIIFLISYAGFAFIPNLAVTGILFMFYGLFQGIFRSTGKSFAADFVPADLRASSIGWYSTIVGLSGLIASVVAGQLWDRVGHTSVFIYGVAFSFLGILFLVAMIRNKRDHLEQ